jgi:anti-repressor protein
MELIKINTTDKGTQAVNAKELYEFLGFDMSNWKRWYSKNIINNQFAIENEDWMGFVIMTSGNETKDFALSIDFAKKLAMMSRTEKGEQARKYFIECEKTAKQAPKQLTRAEILGLAVLELQNMNEELKSSVEQANTTIQIQAPKVEYYDKVINSTGTYNTNLIAKELGMSAVTLNKQLKDLGVQYYQNNTWVLTAKYQVRGYTKTKTFTFNAPNGETKTSMQTVWTERGREFIHELILKSKSEKAA